MKLVVTGSSSSGNGYALVGREETLLIEAGVKYRDVVRNVGKPIANTVGVIVSHRHGDHCGHISEYNFDIYSNEDTIDFIKGKCNKDNLHILEPDKPCNIGGFKVIPFLVWHDVPDFGYIVYHKEMGMLFFATDCYNIPFTLKSINHYLIEANYEDGILRNNVENGTVSGFLAHRLMTSHFSIDNAVAWLKRSHAQTSDDITLIHLSAKNSSRELFASRIENEIGVPCYIAKKGLILDY